MPQPLSVFGCVVKAKFEERCFTCILTTLYKVVVALKSTCMDTIPCLPSQIESMQYFHVLSISK